LDPSKEGDDLDGGNTVGDVVGAEATGCEVKSESVSLRGNVSEDSKHGNAAVLKFRKAIIAERPLADSVGKTSGIPKSSGGECSNLVLKTIDGGGIPSTLGGSEGSGRTSRSLDLMAWTTLSQASPSFTTRTKLSVADLN